MQRWLFIASVCLLVIGTVLLGIGLYPTTVTTSTEKTLGNQTGASFLTFSFPTRENMTGVFSASGNFTIENSTILTIVNQTGAIEYYQQVSGFPITAHLLNSTGEYRATFKPMLTTNSTNLLVNTTVTDKNTSFEFANIGSYAAFFFCSGLIVLPLGIYRDFVKDLNTDKTLKKPFFKATIWTLVFGYSFFTFLLTLLLFGVVLFPTYYLIIKLGMISTGILVSSIGYLVTAVLIVGLLGFCYWVYRRLSQVNVKTSFRQIIAIQRIAKIVAYLSILTIFIYIPILILYITSPFNLTISPFGFIIVEMVILTFFYFVNSMQTREGNIIVYLLGFLDEYETKECKSNFYSITEASGLISSVLKPFNLKCAESSISAAISYQVIVKNDTSKIRDIVSAIEEYPLDYCRFIFLIEGILAESKALDSKGFSGLPSIRERLDSNIVLIGTVIGIITSVITVTLALITAPPLLGSILPRF